MFPAADIGIAGDGTNTQTALHQEEDDRTSQIRDGNHSENKSQELQGNFFYSEIFIDVSLRISFLINF